MFKDVDMRDVLMTLRNFKDIDSTDGGTNAEHAAKVMELARSIGMCNI